ncbi:hypothetical protein [Streptomyces sp. Tu 3180]|uniref:hypothetical protein n=1 Tax=Streptomyces sp. Tu 3180 TaxID=2682611 RepID=UPI001356EDB2|nr:hypothetical protein [Streptomyces sp. Tu 3180]KAF3467030.1 hypothetical protein GL259_23800 [Streptomyces sp. Tu 3180]
MYRSLYHEIRATGTALVAAAVCAAVTGAVRGFPPLPGAPPGTAVAVASGVTALVLLLDVVFDVRSYRAAAPLAEDVALPPDEPLRGHLFLPGLFPVIALPTLAMALAWEPWTALMPLPTAAGWLLKATTVAVWERRNGKLLWRRSVPLGSWKLATSPVSRRPATRTATGAPDV